ncbi:ABC transporter ATP-binding protein [Breoghania sp.]|uniref:energy-coupling factor ABC transporter ATP-binding protein n=1 Tax=Breoghania sp. TaxID=2065378 RepID=UPI0026384049|nr:ABC transporter ATP-binding protein [Breoghania sp.]MDJ0930795.1 ABC transporter ATP-binding protein [Breoghania sp.]
MTTFEVRDVHVHQRFDTFEALKGIDLTLTEKRIGIVGSNGSGKSTFARFLNGLRVPTKGQVLVDGLDTVKNGKAVRRKVGFVFQNPDNQIVFPIVEEDVAFGLKELKQPKAQRGALVEEVLDRYGLGPFRYHPSHALSGGQKQLLALSGVLVTRPDCVVFDEPTTLLDLRNARKVARVIADLEETVIIVTHDLPLLEHFDRVIVFDHGKVIADDEPDPALKFYVERMQ